MPERTKGADCKSAGTAFGGSNPPPTTKQLSEAELPSTVNGQPSTAPETIVSPPGGVRGEGTAAEGGGRAVLAGSGQPVAGSGNNGKRDTT